MKNAAVRTVEYVFTTRRYPIVQIGTIAPICALAQVEKPVEICDIGNGSAAALTGQIYEVIVEPLFLQQLILHAASLEWG